MYSSISSTVSSTFSDGFDSDLFKDEEDKNNLLLKSDREREQILADRYDRRKRLKDIYLSNKEEKKRKKNNNNNNTITKKSAKKKVSLNTIYFDTFIL